MIIVSTTSDREAESAAFALEDSLPEDMGYRVYLHGNLRAHRPQARPEPAREAGTAP